MSRSAWLLRGLLAALLAFTSEILLWTTPDSRPPFDWLLLVFGYLAVSAVLLDLAARYRLRDPFGLLALAGVYGLLNALLLNPTSAFIDFPRTFFTRAMGGHTVAGLLALALWLRLTRNSQRGRWWIPAGAAALLVGVVWGFWAHYSPPVFAEGGEITLPTLLIVFGGGALLLLVLAWSVQRIPESLSTESFRLNRLGGSFVFIVFVTLLGGHLAAGDIDALKIAIVLIFAIFCIGIVWFQKRQKGAAMLDDRRTDISLPLLAALLALMLIGGLVGYHLPHGYGQTDPLAVIGSLLTAYGLVWLPVVTFVLGAREFTKQSRAMRL